MFPRRVSVIDESNPGSLAHLSDLADPEVNKKKAACSPESDSGFLANADLEQVRTRPARG